MQKAQELIEDPFFAQRLNPLFLKGLKTYLDILNQTVLTSEEEREKSKAQTNILLFALLRLFQPLYLKYPPKIKGSIFFLSCVYPDGLGDYFSLLKSAGLIKKNHPLLDIQIVYTRQQKVPSINPADFLLSKHCLHSFLESSNPLYSLK